MIVKIEKEEDKQAVAQALLKQNQNAMALGVCVASFEIARDDLLRAFYGKPEYALRLGALAHEFEAQKAFFMETIRRTQAEQKAAGERALRAAGLDPVADTFTIDMQSWAVSKLVEGKWVQEFDEVKKDEGKAE